MAQFQPKYILTKLFLHPLYMLIILKETLWCTCILKLSSTENGAGHWKLTPRKTRTCLHYMQPISWLLMTWWCKEPGSRFTNVSRALQHNLAKIHNTRNHIYGKNFKLKLCMCAQSHALGIHTKFQLEILARSTISAIQFQENILESSRNVSETTPWPSVSMVFV